MNVNIKKVTLKTDTLDVEYGENIQEGSASVKKSCDVWRLYAGRLETFNY